MNSIKTLAAKLIQSHTDSEIQNLITLLIQASQSDNEEQTIDEFMTQIRYKEGVWCAHCGSFETKKAGHTRKGTQRYACKSCGKTFTASTNSIFSQCKLSLGQIKTYIESLLRGDTIRESKKSCGLSVRTCFFWRHKLLDCLSQVMKTDVAVEHIAEVDETFYRVSYKGNHNKALDDTRYFTMPREARKRGLSKEQHCIITAVDRQRHAFGLPVCTGSCGYDEIERALAPRLSEQTTICTDGKKTYNTFAQDYDINIRNFVGNNKCDAEGYGIQHVNNYHKQVREMIIHTYHGVASKYIQNYFALFNFAYYALKNVKTGMADKIQELLEVAGNKQYVSRRWKQPRRSPIYVI